MAALTSQASMKDTDSAEENKVKTMDEDPDHDSSETASPAPAQTRPRKASKCRTDTDLALIACVRARPVLYDPDHSRYMDVHLKNSIWSKIGKQLQMSPSACKARWNNIRDNYRKWLRKRARGLPNYEYKFAKHLVFMDRCYKGPPIAANDSDSPDEREDQLVTVDIKNIKVSLSDNEDQESVDEFDRSSLSVSGNQMAGLPSASQAQVVDAFLAAIATSLKGLNPYHLSKAKAEIFATVHKYEMKGIVDGVWGARDDNPFP